MRNSLNIFEAGFEEASFKTKTSLVPSFRDIPKKFLS
jgi:hypothetical protein